MIVIFAILATINCSQLLCTQPSPNSDSALGVGNCQNHQYYVIVGVGTPPQYFNLQIDTGSNILWIPTLQTSPKGFKSDSSSTYKNLSKFGFIEYVNKEQVNGHLGEDYLTLPNTTINLTMTMLFVFKEKLVLPQGIDGVIGFGYPLKSVFGVAHQQHAIDSSVFSFRLRNMSEESTLYFNQIAPQIPSTSLFSPVSSQEYWGLKLIGLYVGDQDLTRHAPKIAIIDSGTSLFYLNAAIHSIFVKEYLPSQHCETIDGFNVCSCQVMSYLPTLTFMFPGVQVHLSPTDYVEVYGLRCYVHVYKIETNPEQVLLGDSLFLKYVITFDRNSRKIGFKGDVEEVRAVGRQYFILSQYFMVFLLGVLLVMGLTLMIGVLVVKSDEIQEVGESEVEIQSLGK